MAQNRLSLPSMVSRHLNNVEGANETFFNPLFLTHSTFAYEPTESRNEETTVDPSVQRIVAMVHKNLHDYKIAKANAARAAREDESKGEPRPEGAVKSESFNTKSKKRDVHFDVEELTKSIPQVKARWQRKFQQRMRHNGGELNANNNNNNNFSNQERVQEVLRQRQILEEILAEHDKIQRDRTSITNEIRTMKEYLNEIRNKLDSSLKKLGSQKVFSEENPRSKRNTKMSGQRRKNSERNFIL